MHLTHEVGSDWMKTDKMVSNFIFCDCLTLYKICDIFTNIEAKVIKLAILLHLGKGFWVNQEMGDLDLLFKVAEVKMCAFHVWSISCQILNLGS